jgi:hypothetical protein
MVGVMLLRGRLPGWTSLAPIGLTFGIGFSPKLKSVSSLFSMKPYPGTMMPVPQPASMVVV